METDTAGERKKRLAAALRANLRRRKDQARAREADPPELERREPEPPAPQEDAP